jgi:hypothetical protein
MGQSNWLVAKKKKKSKLNVGGDYVTQLVPIGISVGAKMVANKFKNQNCAHPMWSCRMHPRGPWKGGKGCEFFLFLFGSVCKVIVKVQK